MTNQDNIKQELQNRKESREGHTFFHIANSFMRKGTPLPKRNFAAKKLEDARQEKTSERLIGVFLGKRIFSNIDTEIILWH